MPASAAQVSVKMVSKGLVPAVLLFSMALQMSAVAHARCADMYTVRSGDTLSGIAAQYGKSQSEVEDANPQITNPDLIGVGDTINIPPCSDSSTGCADVYTIQSGDTLSGIASQYGVTTDDMLEVNPDISDPDLISVGQQLNVPPCSGGSNPPPTTPAPTPLSNPPPTGGENFGVTYDKFVSAVTAAGYSTPSETKYNSFINGISDGNIESLRELAMFLAQILHESGGLVYKREIACADTGCPGRYEYPQYDVAGQDYYGRGYIQLTWSYNYRAASEALYGDDRLLSNADQVATVEDTAWGVSYWFWRANVGTDPDVKNGNFGASTLHINGGECTCCVDRAQNRYRIYTQVLPALGSSEAPIESGCY